MRPTSPAHNRRFERTKSVQLFARDFSDEQVAVMRELFDLCDADGDGNISAFELRQVMKELGLQVGKEEFEQLFQALDTNNDQMISFGDFLSGLKWIQKSIRISDSSGIVPVRKSSKPTQGDASPTATSPQPSTRQAPPSPSTSTPTKRHGRSLSVTQFIEETGGMSDAELAKMKKLFKECDENQNGTVSKREMWNFLHNQGVEASKEEFLSFFSELDDEQKGALSFKQFVTGIQGLRKGLYILRAAPAPAPVPASTKAASSPPPQRQNASPNSTPARRGSAGARDMPRPVSATGDDSARRIAELEKTNEILRSHIQEFASKMVTQAYMESKTQHPKMASKLLDLVDYPRIRQLEGLVNLKLTTPNSDEAYAHTQRQLSVSRK